MSQTLSLPPGKYSLFITPPVAGVDFTGTPTPSVSYQWRKNGTAVSGQTAATISGVWVGETGGTVDLADGDTISIDIILTNPVQVTTKTVSAVIDASIPAPVISPISIRLVSQPTTPVSTIPNASIGSQIMVASTGSVSVVTTPPLIPSYQWRRGFAAIAGANSQTYTLQAADADSIIDCVVTATNSGGTATRTASVAVGTQASVTWTTPTPAATSRIVYVAEDGDDVAAAAVKGRGYYLPSDSEIGADPTQPSGTIVAYRTLGAARAKASQSWWLLLKRGDTFPITLHLAFGSTWIGAGVEGAPSVIGAWGPDTDPRPLVVQGPSDQWTGGMNFANGPYANLLGPHLYVMHIDFDVKIFMYTGSAATPSGGMLFEGCRFRQAFATTDTAWITTATMRRCVIEGSWNSASRNQGMFVSRWSHPMMSPEDTRLLDMIVEECVWDRNGYREDPDDATTWTALAGGLGSLPTGQGVQPKRTTEDRNIYVQANTQFIGYHLKLTVRGSIFSRGGGGGSLQQRQGGIVDRNLFMWNEAAGFVANGPGGIYKDNVVLHDDHMLPPTGWGHAIGVWNELNPQGDPVYVMDGNVAAHFHRRPNGNSGFYVNRFFDVDSGAQMPGTALVINNTFFADEYTSGLTVLSATAPLVRMTGNKVAVSNGKVIDGEIAARSESGGALYEIDGNLYHSQSATPFGGNRTFAQWQALRSDLDDSSSFLSDFTAFKTAAGWTAPERDIVSYMQSVDPTYVPDEDVYIDEDSTVKQANRQKVWEVLTNPSNYPNEPLYTVNVLLDEARAKLTARRYHAFLAFIQRAKENRKGAWDPRWTAEAVNNYIREGFGKAAVTGAYDNRPLAERLLDYTT